MSSLPQLAANDNRDEYTSMLEQVRMALRRLADLKVGAAASFAEREVAVLDAANDACRVEVQRELQATADGLADRLLIDGVPYERHQDGNAAYHSLCGPLPVSRPTYRKVGERNGLTIVPLDLAAGIIEGATPALAYRLALGYAQGPGRRVEEQIHADHRRPPSRSTMERLAKTIGTQVKSSTVRIEPLLRQEEKLPEGAHAVSVGLDRTSVPMEEPRPADAPPATRRKKRTKPYVRRAPARVDVKYRMAYVGTVSVVDQAGESLITRRYAASATERPEQVVGRMMADVRRALEQSAAMPVGIMQDAAPEVWTLVRAGLKEQAGVSRWHEGVDRYHLAERLAEILHITEPDESRRRQRLAQWNRELDTDDGTIDRIAQWLSDRIGGHAGQEREKLEAHWTFLFNNNDRMRYVELRRAGLPCGSGATEGACKSVVMIRAKGCGQRWHDDGVNAALTLRAVYMSERLPTLWPHFAREYVARMEAAA
jgi:hypothetical protein